MYSYVLKPILFSLFLLFGFINAEAATKKACKDSLEKWQRVSLMKSVGDDRYSEMRANIPEWLVGRIGAFTFSDPIDGKRTIVGKIISLPRIVHPRSQYEDETVKGSFAIEVITEAVKAVVKKLEFASVDALRVKPVPASERGMDKKQLLQYAGSGWKKINFHIYPDLDDRFGETVIQIPDYLKGRIGVFIGVLDQRDLLDEGKSATTIEGKIIGIPRVRHDREGYSVSGDWVVQTREGKVKIPGLNFNQLKVKKNEM